MIKPGLIESLPELTPPVLTAYLDTSRATADNRALESKYLISLKSGAKRLEESLYPEDLESFRLQAGRTEAYLRNHPPRSKGVIIFAGRNNWEFVPVEAKVEDEVHWGAPDLTQLLWLVNEHRPQGVVIVGRKHAQFFLYWLGELLEVEDKEFVLEPGKEKEMGPVARSFGVRVSRGTNRDVYEHHLDAEYSHYYDQIADRIRSWSEAEHLQSVFLLGTQKEITAIQKSIPLALRDRVVLIDEDLGWASRAEVRERIEPIVAKHEGERQQLLVNELLNEGRNRVVGLDETLARLQQGRVRILVIAQDIHADLKRCSECLWADRTSDPVCPACGRERYAVTLRAILPELVRRYSVDLEIVSGEAACRLKESGEMGAWLREFEMKEYGEHLTFR